MDSAQILAAVADFGALGIASAAIFWIFLKTSRRLDDLTDSFQTQLKEQSDSYQSLLREQTEECNRREAAVRDRYDAVVRKYDEERLQVTTRLDSIDKELGDVEDLLKTGLGEMRSHYSKIGAALGRDV